MVYEKVCIMIKIIQFLRLSYVGINLYQIFVNVEPNPIKLKVINIFDLAYKVFSLKHTKRYMYTNRFKRILPPVTLN